jgi:hypothetical protein
MTSLPPVRLRGERKDSLAGHDRHEQSPDYGEPKDAWKTDLLAVLLIFAFAVVAVLTFLR